MWHAVRLGLDALERRICLLSFIHVMSVEDKLKVVASSVLESLFSSHAVTAPISSFDLLTRVVAFGPPPAGLFPDSGPVPRFRLVDLARFERVLERLAEKWDQGRITLARDQERDGSLTVMAVQLGTASSLAGQVQHTPVTMKKKRKRVVDEDDDSAVGRAQEAEESTPEKAEPWKPAPSTLESLNKTMKEVYTLMQQSTAKGRLLAEQVSAILVSVRVPHEHSHEANGTPVPVTHR